MESKLNNAVETIRARFLEFGNRPAVWKNGKSISYLELNQKIDSWQETLSKIESGSIVGIRIFSGSSSDIFRIDAEKLHTRATDSRFKKLGRIKTNCQC